jgi:DNA modification methylase
MEPFLSRDGITIYNGNVLDVLRALPSDSVHCCCTSPPYFGLRDYGLPPSVWGGDPACEHEWGSEQVAAGGSQKQGATSQRKGRTNIEDQIKRGASQGQFCQKCSAWMGCYGLEPTPEIYVQHTVEIFREVRRVLRPDGTLWLNIGDTYNHDSKWGGSSSNKNELEQGYARKAAKERDSGCKPKDLIGVPWMVAFALRADGWYLRSEIIWAKNSPMPESVEDRPTKAHEQIFVLTRDHENLFLLTQEPQYFYDNVASAEPATSTSGGACIGKVGSDGPGSRRVSAEENQAIRGSTRNMRSVWHLSSEPYKKAHFAVYPTEIPRRALLAGTSEKGCCAKCGAPWVRQLERKAMVVRQSERAQERKAARGFDDARTATSGTMVEPPVTHTVGWESTCECNAPVAPCVVLDPFFGSGTTGAVAQELGCRCIGIELNPDYCKLAAERFQQRSFLVG